MSNEEIDLKKVVITVDIENIEEANELISVALRRVILAENALHDIKYLIDNIDADVLDNIESILNNHEQELKEILND